MVLSSRKITITKNSPQPKTIFGCIILCALCFSLYFMNGAYAQVPNIPGSADVSRIVPQADKNLAPEPVKRPVTPEAAPQTPLPPEAAEITMKLEGVDLQGVTAFTQDEIFKIYRPLIGKTIKLSEVWGIAEKITDYYREKGYFLSRAYIPQQEIADGVIKINVVEGYIGKVVLDDPIAEKRLVKDLLAEITAQHPITAEKLEEIVLRLNDLPGHNFRSILKPLENAPEGATQLVLLPSKDPGRGALTAGNSGSRFLGPWVDSLTYQTSLIDMQQTTLSFAASSQIDELRYGTISQDIPLTPRLSLGLTGNFVVANPGYDLRKNDIQSYSTELGVKLSYRNIRQWQRNMTLGLAVDGRNTNSDIFDTPLTRDRVRALRGSVDYDFVDSHNAYNAMNVTISHGLSMLSSSEEGDPFLSRGQAVPDFTKIEGSYKHQRYLSEHILATGQVSGQLASQPLFSSEEFGYGGQAFGRAYDNSEISGDEGVAGSLELGYANWLRWTKVDITPFIFYDIGKVWNFDRNSEPVSGSSAGGGMHMIYNSRISLDLTAAQPLTKPQETPLGYGSPKSTRYLLQMNANF
jgi:hemolysin activation/secretion protein